MCRHLYRLDGVFKVSNKVERVHWTNISKASMCSYRDQRAFMDLKQLEARVVHGSFSLTVTGVIIFLVVNLDASFWASTPREPHLLSSMVEGSRSGTLARTLAQRSRTRSRAS